MLNCFEDFQQFSEMSRWEILNRFALVWFCFHIGAGVKVSVAVESKHVQARIVMDHPYDPEKIPVLMIHGLFSSPETWQPMINGFNANPEMEKFQYWYFSYPTGMSTIAAAATLKKRLDALVQQIETEYDVSLERQLMVVGHSMGGILAKSLISESGDKLWNAVFTAPIEVFNLDIFQKQFLSSAFRFKPRSYVNKVIFIATPHRGSALAKGLPGKLAASLTSKSRKQDELVRAVRERNQSRLRPQFARFLRRGANSVGTLQPDSPITNVLAELSIDPGAEFHSISGVHRIAMKGDGVVPLHSTMLRDAYCELGVFSDHQVHKKEKAIGLTSQMLLTDFDNIPRERLVERLRSADLAFFRLGSARLREVR